MKYVHTNLVARDWKRLTVFYMRVFDCKLEPPERDLSGEWLDKAVSLHGAHIRGAHLRLPGYTDGPTLEIFQYDDEEWAKPVTPNMPGYGHIAFSVSDVKATADKVVEQGGSWVGELTRVEIKGVGTLEFAYMRDPEGNIIEIQKHGD